MKKILLALGLVIIISCDEAPTIKENAETKENLSKKTSVNGKQFKGAISNGMKGDSIFFNVSEDGKKLTDLMFKGYWRCSGTLESTTAGPDTDFDLINGKVKRAVSVPPDGGSTAQRFDLDVTIIDNLATGTFRMNINNLGCDTYLLKFAAMAQ